MPKLRSIETVAAESQLGVNDFFFQLKLESHKDQIAITYKRNVQLIQKEGGI